MTKRPLVIRFSLDSDLFRDEEKRAVVNDWLKANGLDPMRILVGAMVNVCQHDDGSLWLHTWQALEGYPLCEHCEECIKQERVEVPLLTDFPAIEAARMPPLRGADTDKEADRG